MGALFNIKNKSMSKEERLKEIAAILIDAALTHPLIEDYVKLLKEEDVVMSVKPPIDPSLVPPPANFVLNTIDLLSIREREDLGGLLSREYHFNISLISFGNASKTKVEDLTITLAKRLNHPLFIHK